MGSYQVASGATDRLAQTSEVGEDFLIKITSDQIRLSLSRENADRGTVIFAGDRAEVRVPPDAKLYAYGDGGTTATVEVFPNGVNQLGPNDEMLVSYTPTGDVSVTGDVDVGDRPARDLGKARLMDDSQTLIKDSNPFPVDLRAANTALDVSAAALTVGTWNAGTLAVEQQTPVALEDQGGSAISASNPLSTARPNHSGLTSGRDTVATSGTAVQLNGGASLTVPDEAGVHLMAPTDNTGSVYIGDSSVTTSTGYELEAGDEFPDVLRVDDVSLIYVDADNDGDAITWVVEQ